MDSDDYRLSRLHAVIPLGSWLAGTAARQSGAGTGWFMLTRFGALYQIATGLLSAAAFLSANDSLNTTALAIAVFGLPVFILIWLPWTLREWRHTQPLLNK